MKKISLCIGLVPLVLMANVTVPPVGSDLKITIYTNNKAFISDKREVAVEAGRQKLVYEGIPSAVITPSVVPSFLGIETNLYSQNYIYDVISLDSMLRNSIDKKVQYYTNGQKPILRQGTLLGISPYVMIRDENGFIVTLEKATQVIFSTVPKTMITKPSLVWNVETQDAGNLSIDLKYLTRGISWKSDYVLNLHKKDFDLKGWITVNNQSGVRYENAKISCIAGEVNAVVPSNPNFGNRRYKSKMVMEMSAMPDVAEESFSGYHLYEIPFKETIENKQQKQIAFINKTKVKYIQYGEASNQVFSNYGEQKLYFLNMLEFYNSKKNAMGIALPAGIVRMYKKSSSGDTHFIGESHIQNIPQDEQVTLTIGKLFDVVGKKKITKYKVNKNFRYVETTYTIDNHGKEERTLKIKEQIPAYGQDISVKTNCVSPCSVEKKNAFIREFTIKLQAKEAYTFTSEFKVQH